MLGVEPARLSCSELVAPFRGARIPTALAADFVARCAALCAREPDAVLSHTTAARLLGLPDLRRLPGEPPPATDAQPEFHLTVPSPARPPRIAGVRSHVRPIRAREVRFANGLPVTSAARTWADLAASSSIRQLVVLGAQTSPARRRCSERANLCSGSAPSISGPRNAWSGCCSVRSRPEGGSRRDQAHPPA
ncbi:hypothetical protein ASE16_18175 [Leifsonia sp. Root227]|uniref:hypothetical protein n=1 Tax=Leifsonia sp. Root227 TaxID=1736496 RepID=UPI0006F95187|nr:hypothetical protein [Leifsonia sp. Root227]KRC47252.1 hypothetical protein ASE16_18175 [Leifsonia sp. Root227]